MRYVKVDDLQPGMIMANTLYDNNETLLIRANAVLTHFGIRRIKQMNYDGLYILEASDDNTFETSPIISEKTRIEAIKNLKKLNIDECLYLANEIVNEIRDAGFKIIQTVMNNSFDNYTYTHSVNVCIYAVLVGIGLGFNDDELKKLSQAALLHDIGKTCVAPEIINKPGRLTDEEFLEVKKHPLYGYNLLKNNEDVYSTVRVAIYSHHENEDGTGYPRGLQGDKIHKFAKIIHVVDVYDALTAKRCYKEALNPGDALEYLLANIGIMFDYDCVDTFRKFVALYPLGTEVLLSNGVRAIVIANNENLNRPVVRTVNGKTIDLMKVLNLTIVELLTGK